MHFVYYMNKLITTKVDATYLGELTNNAQQSTCMSCGFKDKTALDKNPPDKPPPPPPPPRKTKAPPPPWTNSPRQSPPRQKSCILI